MKYSQNLLYIALQQPNEFFIILFLLINMHVLVLPFFCVTRPETGVDYRFSPPRITTSYYYCYTDMRIKAYKGNGYTIQLIVKAAHTAQ